LSEVVVPRNDAENTFLCDWAAKRIGQGPFKNARALGFANQSGLVAAIVLHDLSPPNVFTSWAVEKGGFSRKLIAAFYKWAFVQSGCLRITALVERKNKRSRKLCEGLGMKLEGVTRKCAPNGQDLFIYGMLREEADETITRVYKHGRQ
jgi:RimJ/RimL family protein N-acetyltransferase